MRQSNDGAELVHVGSSNFLSISKILVVVTTGSAPIQRLIREGKRKGTIIDMTGGKRTKAAVFTDSGAILLLAISPEGVARRVSSRRFSGKQPE